MLTTDECIRILSRIGKRKTAPFYEARVVEFITGELNKMDIGWESDEVGNIIARYVGSSRRDANPLVLVAHMDHPAFEIVDQERQTGHLLGGVNIECFSSPVNVLVYPALPQSAVEDEIGIPGVITGADKREDGTFLNLELSGKCPALPAFGVWDFLDLEVRDGLAYMRACDDLVGCAMILTVLDEARKRGIQRDIIGVFTRAEEVCFSGSMHVARNQAVPRDSIVVSLETSKALPGAEIGGGPVIRTGDKLHTFDDGAESVLRHAYIELRKMYPDIQVQRQLMGGGGCEASVFAVVGYATTAMALPLGNFHNVDPDLTLAPEYISPMDMAVEVELLLQAAQICLADCRSIDLSSICGNYETGLRRLAGSPTTANGTLCTSPTSAVVGQKKKFRGISCTHEMTSRFIVNSAQVRLPK
ncbi:MAG: M28 family peptidase [Armatimonadetes bacterium]|nr:M28 family peptidase [Armatimonadota bacterium]